MTSAKYRKTVAVSFNTQRRSLLQRHLNILNLPRKSLVHLQSGVHEGEEVSLNMQGAMLAPLKQLIFGVTKAEKSIKYAISFVYHAEACKLCEYTWHCLLFMYTTRCVCARVFGNFKQSIIGPGVLLPFITRHVYYQRRLLFYFLEQSKQFDVVISPPLIEVHDASTFSFVEHPKEEDVILSTLKCWEMEGLHPDVVLVQALLAY